MPQTPEEIKKALSKFKDLPTLPDVVAKVMRIVSNPLTTAENLNQVISLDQALTFKVLRLANSAYYGFPQEITTITQAVTILGFNTIRNLALSISVHKMLFSDKERAQFSHRDFWKHCVGVAVCAKILAKRVGYKSEDNAFTAGLLHDIGKNVLDKIEHDGFAKALRVSHDEKVPLWEAEQKYCGVDHAYVGGLLAQIWNLPLDLRIAVERHHDLGLSSSGGNTPDVLAAVVHAANEICRQAGVGSGGDAGPIGMRPEVKSMLNLKDESMGLIVEELNVRMKEAEDFLKIVR
jgi:putative nucleotidyltransferase with HDIG domain